MTFKTFTDTEEGIAQELVQAGLVDPQDVIVVASNLKKLIDIINEPNISMKNVIFALVSCLSCLNYHFIYFYFLLFLICFLFLESWR